MDIIIVAYAAFGILVYLKPITDATEKIHEDFIAGFAYRPGRYLAAVFGTLLGNAVMYAIFWPVIWITNQIYEIHLFGFWFIGEFRTWWYYKVLEIKGRLGLLEDEK